MLEVIVEAIAEVLADHFIGKAVEKGVAKTGRARGWIALGVLVALFAFLIWLGVYLVGAGVWPIAVLMLLIAALLVYVTVVPVVRRKRKEREEEEIPPT